MVSQSQCQPEASAIQRKNYVFTRRRTDSLPWIVWRIWDRYLHDQIQDIKDGKNIIQRSYLSEKFQNILNPCGIALESKDAHLFQAVQAITLEEREPGSPNDQDYMKILVRMKHMNGTYNTLETFKSDEGEKWDLYAFGDLAGVLRDTLKPDDIVVIWGGLTNPGSTTISLNLRVNAATSVLVLESYMAIYRHGDSPDEQFHTNDVINDRGLENTIVQKICPIVYPAKVPASASESEVLFSQPISIGLDTQEYVQMNDEGQHQESERLNFETTPGEKQCAPTNEPGVSQYSIDRLFDDLERRDCVEESDEEQNDSISENSVKTLERVPTFVSRMQLCDLNLKRVRQFHLKCRILKIHVDEKENIIMIRVSDGTIPPFCAKELLPRFFFQSQSKPDQSAMVLATLEVDILIRNSSEFVQEFNELRQEVILYNVSIEKDKNNVIMLTMDGSSSRIEKALPDNLLKLDKRHSPNANPCSDVINGESNNEQYKDGGRLKRRPPRRLRRISSSIDEDDSSDLSVPVAKVAKLTNEKVRPNTPKPQSPNMIAATPSSSQSEIQLRKLSVRLRRLDSTNIKVGTPVKLSSLFPTPNRSPEKPGPSKLLPDASSSTEQMTPSKRQTRIGIHCREISASTPTRSSVSTERSTSTCHSPQITRNAGNPPSASPGNARRRVLEGGAMTSTKQNSPKNTPRARNGLQQAIYFESSSSDSE